MHQFPLLNQVDQPTTAEENYFFLIQNFIDAYPALACMRKDSSRITQTTDELRKRTHQHAAGRYGTNIASLGRRTSLLLDSRTHYPLRHRHCINDYAIPERQRPLVRT